MDTSPSLDARGVAEAKGKPKAAAANRVRRRNRMITSCLECRRRKLKCDKLQPCTNCSKFSRDCVFLAPALDTVSQQRLNEIKEQIGSLERVLEHDVARKERHRKSTPGPASPRKTSADLPGGEDSSSDDEADVPEDEKGLEPTPYAVLDGAYDDDGANDDVLDLGIKVGKMCLTERLGGLFRPRMTEEITSLLSQPTDDARTADERRPNVPHLPADGLDFLSPGPSYIEPGSGFLFGDVGNKRSLINFLPAKVAGDALIRRYYDNVHFICRVLHWPSFQLHYDNFWTSVLAGIEPPAWQQALVLSVLFAAVPSMPDDQVSGIFARPKSAIQSNFQTGTEVALSKAQFLRATKLETLQALVIYLIPMCRDQPSRAHSVLVGMAVRLAECMGLHRDPADVYGLPPVVCHIRRTLWFQLCFLDFRTCEAQGPRPGIKRDDYDTRFPLNIDDTDLLMGEPHEVQAGWTDMTTSRIRFECTEMQRVVWQDRIRIEKKRASLTHVLSKIEIFRKAMEAKYTPLLDVSVPIQHYAKLVMTLMIQRLYVMILHRYMTNADNKVPGRLAQLTVDSSILVLESAVAIESNPELGQYRWYRGAYQQWHIAFLLLNIVYHAPHMREADRIWAILDYAFEPDLSLSRSQKARSILATMRDRIAVYRNLRKFRVPVSMRGQRELEAMASPDLGGDGPTSGALKIDGEDGPVDTGSYAADESWTFDTPATMYLQSNLLPNDSRNPFKRDRGVAPASPHDRWQPQQQPQPQQLLQSPALSEATHASPGHQPEFLSPSDSGTNESWPPLITTDQVSWQTVITSGANVSATAAPVHMSATAVADTPPPVGARPAPPRTGPGHAGYPINMSPLESLYPQEDSTMLDIDWAEWDQLFPLNSTSGAAGQPDNFGLGRAV